MTTGQHLDEVRSALDRLAPTADEIERCGADIGAALASGATLLAVGNGGSAAQAQHLTAELVGRYVDERRPLAAIALGAEHATATAVGNDYGFEQTFARQVRAHGRPGGVLVALSTSGRSLNVLSAADAATRLGMYTLALTGPEPNPLSRCCDDAIVVQSSSVAAIQEVHQVVIHLLCAAIDDTVRSLDGQSQARNLWLGVG